MNKTIYRIMGIIVAFALILGGFSNVEAVSDQSAASSKPVYAYYYLWWSTKHWQDKLGSSYPYSASPLPLPAKTDADGCNPVSNYAANQLLDIPTRLVSQDEPGAIEEDIRLAKNTGLTGFWLNWGGDGTTTQTRTSVSYTRRLAEAFAASKRVGGFNNWVSYKAAAREPANYIINDLNFLYKEFKDETAWEKIDGKPVVTFTGSRAYSDADVQKISNAVRDRMYLVGDESRKTLTPARLAMFDAITYYWSTQDPYGNPQSFDQIKEMGDKVHAAGKRWYAPLNPGYNSILLKTGSCIPRKNGETLRTIWNGNLKSNPDGWGFISWNEIAENSHIKPMQKWGDRYLNVIKALINSIPVPGKASLDLPNGSIETNYKPTYIWKKVSHATWYYLWIDGPSGNVLKKWYEASAVCDSDTCSVKPDITLQGGAHTWWIQTWNIADYGPWSAGMKFSTTIPGLEKTTLSAPMNSITTNMPTYTWREVSAATYYYLWVDGPSGTVIKIWYTPSQANCNGGTCSVTPTTTLGAGTYRWWVQTYNSAGYGPWSDGLDFTVSSPSVLPGKAVLSAPMGSITTNVPTYTWHEVSAATYYYLWVDGPSGTVIKIWYTPSQAKCNGSTCSVIPTTLGTGTYRWWVQTWNETGYGPWSEGKSFTIQ